MQKKPETLTEAKLALVASRRAAARDRARQTVADEGERPEECSAVADADNPPLTDAQLRGMKPAHVVRPALVSSRLPREPAKKRATLS